MEEDRSEATGGDRRRLTVSEAAETPGVTVDAVRGRIRRGKLEAEHHEGAVYVWVDVPEDADGARRSAASQRPSADQSQRVEDLREQVAYLREQLDRERRPGPRSAGGRTPSSRSSLRPTSSRGA